jgi:7-cyano-7-deazaguanine synthase in queuosine biosynthesis
VGTYASEHPSIALTVHVRWLSWGACSVGEPSSAVEELLASLVKQQSGVPLQLSNGSVVINISLNVTVLNVTQTVPPNSTVSREADAITISNTTLPGKNDVFVSQAATVPPPDDDGP